MITNLEQIFFAEIRLHRRRCYRRRRNHYRRRCYYCCCCCSSSVHLINLTPIRLIAINYLS